MYAQVRVGIYQNMAMLIIVLLVAAALCFGIAAFGGRPGRPDLVALGLLFWVLTVLLPRVIT